MEMRPHRGSGLIAEGLDRVDRVMHRHVAHGTVPGLVALVARDDDVHAVVEGTAAVDGTDPVRRDSIFRISSMTKPITAVAALVLVEECEIRLDEPVDRLLPELADRQVLEHAEAPLNWTVPASRPITVRDLLTFTMGLGIVMAAPGAVPLADAMADLELGQGPPSPAHVPPPDEWMARLGTLPLLAHPGERWMYHTGSDVLGVLIARASGQPFESFLRDHVLDPLGMVDTGFDVPEASLHRLVPAYQTLPDGTLVAADPVKGQWSHPPAFPSGGAGLVSTADDYLAFARMLLAGGCHDGTRLIGPAAVRAMTADQLTPAQKAEAALVDGWFTHHGWGFGVTVTTRPTDVAASVGTYGWDGGLGTGWRSDPVTGLTTILMTQAAWPSPDPPAVCTDLRTAASTAIGT